MKKLRLCFKILSSITFLSQLAFAADDRNLPIDSAEKLVLKVSEGGFEPKTIELHQEDSSVFVVNASKNSLLTISVDFKGKKTHCASGNLTLESDGILKSNSPIAPKDFALFCIPEKGHYDVVAYGMTPKPIQASLEVK